MRSIVHVCALMSLLLALPFLATAQPPPSPPGIRYALGGHNYTVNNLVVSKDGLTFASASDDTTVKVWRMSDGMLLHTYQTNQSPPFGSLASVALSPDGTTVAAGDRNNRIWMWRLTDDSLIRRFYAFTPSNNPASPSLSYSMDGSTLAASGIDSVSGVASYDINLFSTTDGHLIKTLKGHTAGITQIAFSPTANSVLASAASDLTVRIWNTGTGTTAVPPINAFTSAGPFCLAFSADGTQVAAGGVDTAAPYYYARVWNVATGVQTASINAYSGSGVQAVAFSPDGTLLATSGFDTSVKYYQPKTFKIATGVLSNAFGLSPPDNNFPIPALVFSNDGGTLISSLNDYSIVQWNVSNGTPLHTVTQFTGPITDFTISADNSQMAVITHNPYSSNIPYTQFRSVATGALFSTFGTADPFAFSPDGLLFGYNGNSILNPANGTTLRTLVRAGALIWFSADDQTVYTLEAAGSPMYVRTWRLIDGALLRTTAINLTGTSGESAMILSNDGTRLAADAGFGGSVLVWSMPDGAQVQAIPASNKVSSNISLSGDGSYVAFGVTGGTDVFVYRVADGMLMLDQPGGAPVMLVALSPFGDSVAAYRSDGSIIVTQIDGMPLAYWNDQFGTGIDWMGYTPDAASILLGRNDSTLLVCYNPAPAALATLTLSQTTADGGAVNPSGTVSINQSAPAGGVPIALSSSNPAVASVPSNVMIAQNATSAIFQVTTSAVTTPTVVTISATLNGVTRNVNLTVNPYVLPKTLTFAPSTVQGGLDAIGVVTLLHPALAGGQVVALSSANPGLVGIPPSITVPAGKTSARFLVQTGPAAAATPVVVTATAGGVTVKGTLTVAPATVAALTLLPNSVQGGVENSIGIVTLSAPATTNVTVNISVAPAGMAGDVTFPASIVIPAGSLNGTFDIGTNTVSAKATVVFKAQIGATGKPGTTSKTQNLTVTP